MEKAHTKYIPRKSRWFWIAVVGLVLVGWVGLHSTASESLTDAQKRQTIEKMVVKYRTDFPDVVEMDSRRAIDLRKDKKIVFIDVRRPNEQEVSMLPGAITHKAYLQNPDKYTDYIKIGYCTIGYRSGQFAQMLKTKGITIYNLYGGMLAWLHAGGKVYDESGQSHRIHVYGRPWNLAPEGYEEVW